MEVILSTSSKGGVGKSQVSKLVAEQLNRDGFDVAMMDADIDSSNLASRMGVDGRVDHRDDDLIEPMEKGGIKIYSMESAFSDSSFSQSGQFMRVVIRNMVNSTNWEDPDYMVVDCPPGTKDIFDELAKVMREDLLGAIIVGQSDAYDDVGRMIKVCQHNYVPIIGLVENMSGVWAEGEIITGPKTGNPISPFGANKIKQIAEGTDARFLGKIPLCDDPDDIEQAGSNCIKAMAIAIQEAEQTTMPESNEGDKGYVRNVIKGLKEVMKTVNEEFDIDSIQQKFGNPNDPKVVAIELEDAKSSWLLPSTIHVKVDNGIRPVKNPDEVEGGIKITSEELRYALEGQRQTMNSTQALYSDNVLDTMPYGLVDAVQMGKAEVYGEDVINYLSLLDKVFEEVIDQSKLQEAVSNV